MAVPLTVIAGFLGVGKTTTLLHLATQRPPDARWIILVNEFGEIGIDGAILSGDSGVGGSGVGGSGVGGSGVGGSGVGGADLAVRELAGGCLCCAGDAPFQQTLARALDELSPDRVLIEPTGLAQAGQIIDTLRRPPFTSQVDLRATLTVVDPRHFGDPEFTRRGDWRSQIEAADILIANRCDLADDAALRTFLTDAAALYPPKKQILTTSHGQVDAALLDLDPRDVPLPPDELSHHHAHGLHAPQIMEQTGRLSPKTVRRLTRRMWSGPDFSTAGWRIPPTTRLSAASVQRTVTDLLAAGVLRIKGVFFSERGWRVVQADIDGVRWSSTGWRGDSRLEVITTSDTPPDWSAVERSLLAGAEQQPDEQVDGL
ncbi:MAG: GTP-binding protein [Myxococcota bacterium]